MTTETESSLGNSEYLTKRDFDIEIAFMLIAISELVDPERNIRALGDRALADSEKTSKK